MRILSNKSLLIVAIFLVCFSACNTKVVTPTHIPADATFVLCADMKSITNKAVDWKNIWQSDYFSNALGLKDAGMLEKIMQSGLDYQQNIYLFSKSTKDDILPNYVGVYATLSKDEDFEKSLKQIFQSQNQKWNIQNIDAHKCVIAEFARQKIWIGWGGKQLFIYSSQIANNANELTKEAQKMLNLTKNDALEQKNADFKNVLSKDFDIAYWYNNEALHGGDMFESLAKNITGMFFLGKGAMDWVRKSTQLINSTTGIINFENGEAKGNAQIHFNDKVLPTFDGLLKPSFDENLAKYLPINNPILCSSLAIAPKGIQKTAGEWGILKGSQYKGALFLLGMNEEELFNIFAGDVIFALDQPTKGKNSVHLLASWKKHHAVDDILDLVGNVFKKAITVEKEKNGYTITTNEDVFYIVEKETMLYVTNQEQAKNDFIAGKQYNNEKILNVLRNQVGATYIDFPKMYSIVPENLSNYFPEIKLLQQNLKTMDNLQIQAPKLDGNIGEIKFSLKSTEKDRNILASLVEIMTKLQKAQVLQ